MRRHLFKRYDFVHSNDEMYKANKLTHNIQRARVFALFFIGYEVWLCMVSFVSMCCNNYSPGVLMTNVCAYLVMLIMCVSFLYIFRRKSETYTRNMRVVRKYETVVWFYMLACMMWGTLISLIHHAHRSSLLILVICLFCCCCTYLTRASSRLLLLAIPSAFFILLLPVVQKDEAIVVSNLISFSMYAPIAFVLGQLVFNMYCGYHESQQQLIKSKTLLELETAHSQTINSKLTEANRMLSKLLSIDELTGISNRRGLTSFLDVTLDNCSKDSVKLSVMMIDVDFFKAYNDSYGHLSGDDVLKGIAKELSNAASGSNNFVARYGGEEFIYVSFGTDEKEIYAVAETLRRRVQGLKIPHKFSTVSQFVSISLGGFCANVANIYDVEVCIEKADKALYMAKKNGRNCFCYYR